MKHRTSATAAPPAYASHSIGSATTQSHVSRKVNASQQLLPIRDLQGWTNLSTDDHRMTPCLMNRAPPKQRDDSMHRVSTPAPGRRGRSLAAMQGTDGFVGVGKGAVIYKVGDVEGMGIQFHSNVHSVLLFSLTFVIVILSEYTVCLFPFDTSASAS